MKAVRIASAAATLLLGAGAAAAAQVFVGTVTRVADGDTLWLQPDDAARRPLKLRLRGIDAPELCQRWGVQSRDALAARVLQRRVSVELRTRDDYGRALGTLQVDGADVSAELVAAGHAWSQRWRGGGPYLREEQKARAARRGLFADPAAIEPRQFRRSHGPCDRRHPARQDRRSTLRELRVQALLGSGPARWPVPSLGLTRASACSCRTGSRSGRRRRRPSRCARRAPG